MKPTISRLRDCVIDNRTIKMPLKQHGVTSQVTYHGLACIVPSHIEMHELLNMTHIHN